MGRPRKTNTNETSPEYGEIVTVTYEVNGIETKSFFSQADNGEDYSTQAENWADRVNGTLE
jgi:hypothetical protein